MIGNHAIRRAMQKMDSVAIAFELMGLELEAEVESLNTDGAKSFRNSDYNEAHALIEKGRALQAFSSKVRELEEEWRQNFADTIERPAHRRGIEIDTRKILSRTKSSRTTLLVRFPSGEVVSEKSAADTMAKVIQKIGIDRVASVGVLVNNENIVSDRPSDRYNETRAGQYYIKTHSNTMQKKRNLDQISEALGLNLEVSII